MGMAASQARFLGLTARKSNTEYEGQQVNQQRTTLANQSANYYNQLLGMKVPTPPSTSDYTKTVYTFEDGNLSNSITSLVAKANGTYLASYVSSWVNDFTPVSAGNAIINKSDDGPDTYTKKFTIGANELRQLGTFDYLENSAIAALNIKANGGTYEFINNLDGNTFNLDKTYFSGKDATNGKEYNDLRLVHDTTGYRYETKDGTQIDLNDIIIKGDCEGKEFKLNNSTTGLVAKGLDDAALDITKANFKGISFDKSYDTDKDPYISKLTPEQITKLLEEEKEYVKMLNKKYGGNSNQDWYVRYVLNSTTGVYSPQFYNKDTVENAIYNPDTGISQSNIQSYMMGSATETEEIKGKTARLEKDSTGRYINITLYDDEEGTKNPVTYSLTTNTVTDQQAYDDAMNQYEYNKYQYDQSITEINAKIEIIQTQDKNLELRLKQLDTEQEAIQTEIDAVSKVIEKNVEKTFNTFG